MTRLNTNLKYYGLYSVTTDHIIYMHRMKKIFILYSNGDQYHVNKVK